MRNRVREIGVIVRPWSTALYVILRLCELTITMLLNCQTTITARAWDLAAISCEVKWCHKRAQTSASIDSAPAHTRVNANLDGGGFIYRGKCQS
jgi:hypothetical protein